MLEMVGKAEEKGWEELKRRRWRDGHTMVAASLSFEAARMSTICAGLCHVFANSRLLARSPSRRASILGVIVIAKGFARMVDCCSMGRDCGGKGEGQLLVLRCCWSASVLLYKVDIRGFRGLLYPVRRLLVISRGLSSSCFVWRASLMGSWMITIHECGP